MSDLVILSEAKNLVLQHPNTPFPWRGTVAREKGNTFVKDEILRYA